MTTIRPVTGVLGWEVLYPCDFVGNGNTFTLWQTLKCSLKCCGFNWAVENGLIFKGWWNASSFLFVQAGQCVLGLLEAHADLVRE